MPQISSIEKQKKRDQRFNVYVDGDFAFAASAETIFRQNLKSGGELDQSAIDKLITENEVGLLYEKTLSWISSRPHSKKEAVDYLHKYNPKATKPRSERAIEIVIEKLERGRFIDDEAFARWYIASRRRSKPRGQRLISLELVHKGIDKELIGRLLDEQMNGESDDAQSDGGQTSEISLALKVAEKKSPSYRTLDDRAYKQKMAAFLARRGFDWDTIKETIDLVSKKR